MKKLAMEVVCSFLCAYGSMGLVFDFTNKLNKWLGCEAVSTISQWGMAVAVTVIVAYLAVKIGKEGKECQ